MKKQAVHGGKGPRRKLCVCVCVCCFMQMKKCALVTGSDDMYVCVYVLKEPGALYGQSDGELRD